jgi:hypothetical protein
LGTCQVDRSAQAEAAASAAHAKATTGDAGARADVNRAVILPLTVEEEAAVKYLPAKRGTVTVRRRPPVPSLLPRRKPYSLAATFSTLASTSAPLDLAPPDCQVHDEWIVHGSSGNRSDRVRKTYVAAWRDTEMVAYERSVGFNHSCVIAFISHVPHGIFVSVRISLPALQLGPATRTNPQTSAANMGKLPTNLRAPRYNPQPGFDFDEVVRKVRAGEV